MKTADLRDGRGKQPLGDRHGGDALPAAGAPGSSPHPRGVAPRRGIGALLDAIGRRAMPDPRRQYPDLAHLPLLEAARTHRRATERAAREMRTTAFFLLFGTLSFLGVLSALASSTIAARLSLPAHPAIKVAIGAVPFVLYAAITIGVHWWINRGVVRPRVVRQLPGRCRACGHRLVAPGAESALPDRCPECGAAVVRDP
ncbi:MAG TPA: zinc ribbon domain-containing protein [Phycisphaerales bacterium]|nr:zinc ribbon domain-containing protein [Phycisphaerales bacterium]HMP38613.1 zinc ribbon domain-containing protein [Phycisphaerales bacterium]